MFLSRANLFFAWIQVMEPLKTPKGQYISGKVDTQKAQKKTSFTKRNSTAFGPLGGGARRGCKFQRLRPMYPTGFSGDL